MITVPNIQYYYYIYHFFRLSFSWSLWKDKQILKIKSSSNNRNMCYLLKRMKVENVNATCYNINQQSARDRVLFK